MRIMLDTNVYDLLLSRPDLVQCVKRAVGESKIELLHTHVQVSELREIPDSKMEKREAALALSQIATSVPVGAFMIGVSTCEDRIGDGWNIKVADIKTASAKSYKDALIAVSADIEADIFVTNDGPFERRIKRHVEQSASKLQVWRWADFCDYILSIYPSATQ